MECATLVKILSSVGINATKVQYDKIVAPCPFAPWTHAKGSDSSPSFGFYKTFRGNWRYKCFTCGESGSMRGFWWRLMRFTRRAHPAAMNATYGVEDRPEIPIEALSYGIGGRHARPTVKVAGGFSGGVPVQKLAPPPPPKLDESHVAPFLAAEIPSHILADRGVSLEACLHFGLGYDEKNRRWVFPVRNREGELVGHTGRTCWDREYCFRCGTMIEAQRCPKCHQVYVKYRHSPGPWRRQSVFGINVATPGVLVVCEGTTDVLRLWDAGVVNPVAVLGSHPSPGQVQLIASVATHVLAMGDGDDAGRKLNRELKAALNQRDVTVEEVAVPDGLDPGSLPPLWIKNNLPQCAFSIDKSKEDR